MDYNNAGMQELLEFHHSSKKKMILGIVFTGVALFLESIGLATIYYLIGFFFILWCIPFYAVGLPFLIKGMIRTIKSNRRISRLRKAQQIEETNRD